ADPGVALAKLESDNALVAAITTDEALSLLAKGDPIFADTKLICGPEYRCDFTLGDNPNNRLTLVGPTSIRLLSAGPNGVADPGEIATVKLYFGRAVASFASLGSRWLIEVGERQWTATSASDDALLAFDLKYDRMLGADPMVPENRSILLSLSSVSGDISISGPGLADGSGDLASGDLASGDGSVVLKPDSGITVDLSRAAPKTMELVIDGDRKAWIDPETDSGSLEAFAASDLLELVRSDASDLMLSLRVAMTFRRSEVVSLAGQTMLALDDASAYFGVDGLLSNAKQRIYWSTHMDALRDMMARGVDESKKVRIAIAGQNDAIDDADGDTLFRLLIGYSADDLAAGGDKELVADLESASMPVRVLASEHLRDINGTTLSFKPDEEVDSRREDVIKKWKARLRNGAIRYSEAE
ncbi:MAG: hypothetical protein AAF745_14385, partial [Planctomycetota bacterium]